MHAQDNSLQLPGNEVRYNFLKFLLQIGLTFYSRLIPSANIFYLVQIRERERVIAAKLTINYLTGMPFAFLMETIKI